MLVQTNGGAGDNQKGFSAWHFVAAFLLILIASAVWLISLFFSGLACSGDNSECARTSAKNGVYEARIVREDETPIRDREILVHFASRNTGWREEDQDAGVAFHTDLNGYVCLQWANEPHYPQVTTVEGTPLFTEFEGGETEGEPRAYLGGWQDLEGRDPPPNCQSSDAGIPWYRAYDARDQWQAKLLLALPIGVVVVALVAVFSYRDRRSRRVLALGWLLLVVDALTFLLLWNVI